MTTNSTLLRDHLLDESTEDPTKVTTTYNLTWWPDDYARHVHFYMRRAARYISPMYARKLDHVVFAGIDSRQFSYHNVRVRDARRPRAPNSYSRRKLGVILVSFPQYRDADRDRDSHWFEWYLTEPVLRYVLPRWVMDKWRGSYPLGEQWRSDVTLRRFDVWKDVRKCVGHPCVLPATLAGVDECRLRVAVNEARMSPHLYSAWKEFVGGQ